jgi:hypothetical protein
MEKYLKTDSPLIKKKIFLDYKLNPFLLKGNFLFFNFIFHEKADN